MLLTGRWKIAGVLAGIALLGGNMDMPKQPGPEKEPVKWSETAGEAGAAEVVDTGSWMKETYQRLGEEEAEAAASLEEAEAYAAKEDGTETEEAGRPDLSEELHNLHTQRLVLQARMEETGVHYEE